MTDTQIDIQALKNDAEFQDNVRLLQREMSEQKSIAKAYQLLDIKLALGDAEDEINEIFTFIVNQAFDTLAGYLTQKRHFDLSDPEEYAVARAIYEHGIQRYSENDRKGAKEIFLVLYHQITDREIRDAMMVHACAAMEGLDFETFIDDFADIADLDPEDPKSVFVTRFRESHEAILSSWAQHVATGQKELEVLSKD